MGLDISRIGVGGIDRWRGLPGIEENQSDTVVQHVIVGLGDGHGMLHGTAVGEHILDALVHHTTSSQHLGSRGIRTIVHTDDDRHGGTCFRLISKPDLEDGRLAYGHIVDNRRLDINLRNRNLLRLRHDFGARTEVVGHLLGLPVAGSLTSSCDKDMSEIVGSLEYVHGERIVWLLFGQGIGEGLGDGCRFLFHTRLDVIIASTQFDVHAGEIISKILDRMDLIAEIELE